MASLRRAAMPRGYNNAGRGSGRAIAHAIAVAPVGASSSDVVASSGAFAVDGALSLISQAEQGWRPRRLYAARQRKTRARRTEPAAKRM